ncbi:hypothetical protein ACJIZ3_021322 [Penstemon smallii]|uniref:BHLH domain-containing protein n=1 Tax=Penstemon smallii TaxID=265156 RepID=A0ABD3SL95_9LAMI
MDSIFLFGDGDRATFLQHMLQSFSCTYVCLWSFLPHQPSNCLLYLDGIYRNGIRNLQQPSTSAGSLGRRLFDAYCETINFVHNGQIPGFAFKNNIPYMELKSRDLLRMSSSEVQLQFYQEAGIKTVVFMGCSTGEIELGMTSEPQVDMEMEMRNWFPLDFSRPPPPPPESNPQYPTADQNIPPPHSSSNSSSLRSLSVDSTPEYSPLYFNINPTGTSFINQEPFTQKESHFERSLELPSTITSTPQHQVIQALSQIRNIELPTIESEDAAMTNAILAVLTSTSSSHQNLGPLISHKSTTAFRRYRAALAPVNSGRTRKINSMFGRGLLFFRNLNMRRSREVDVHGNRTTTVQLHHMIAERKRREKINESFQVLRSLLPAGSKKDKASVLGNTTEFLSSLKSQVEELSKRNQILEAQLINSLPSLQKEANISSSSSSSSVERVHVEVIRQVTSTSESALLRFLDLRVDVRGESFRLSDLVIRVLEFLKRQKNVELLSVESNTRMVESTQVHGVMLRLKIEGHEFDESDFREAVRKVIDDIAN